jgi:hypothetical protein
MVYKNDLQLAYSGREIALQRIEIIDSTVFNDQSGRKYSETRRNKYQRLLEKSAEKISAIKSRIRDDIAAKKIQLEEYKTESNHVDTRYKLGEISLQECEREQNILQKKYDRVKQEAVELDRLLETSKSLEIGGQIVIDIEKEVDDHGNINRKTAPLNIPSDVKIPNIDAFSYVNVLSGISTQGLSFSRGNLLSLFGSIGGIIAIFLPWIVLQTMYGGYLPLSLYGLSEYYKQLLSISSFVNGEAMGFFGVFASYSLILLLLLLVCVFFSTLGRGALAHLAHVGIGAMQFGMLLLFFSGMAILSQEGIPSTPGHGYYVAIIFSLVLIYGGITEWREG